MHITIAGLLLILFFGAPVSAQTVTVHQVPLDQDDPYRDRIDNLIWRGGLEIVSSDKRFGGLSGLHVSADGKRLIAVSDRGHWITARLRYRNGVLTDLDHLKIGPCGGPTASRLEGDGSTRNRWRSPGMVICWSPSSAVIASSGIPAVGMHPFPAGRAAPGRRRTHGRKRAIRGSRRSRHSATAVCSPSRKACVSARTA